jgi:hypothetical protein
MKKFICFLVILVAASSIYAFDKSLIGSWGVINSDGGMDEFLRFGNNEILVVDTLFRSSEYKEIDGSVYINISEKEMVIQYYLLSRNKLLFILWSDDIEMTMTLILSRL